MRYQIEVEFDVPAKMRDGTILRANIFRPKASGQYPVVLCRTPYNKDFGTANPILDAVRLAREGYIVVVQDVRGRGTSDGEWVAFMHEAQDGYDAVEWAAKLPDSNGNVGMFGASYVGFTQWATAVQAPPHLKAIMPSVTWANADDGLIWRGGVFELGLMGYLLTFGFGLDTLARQSGDAPQNHPNQAIRVLADFINDLPATGYLSLLQDNFDALHTLGLGDEFVVSFIDRAGQSPIYCSPFPNAKLYQRVQVPSYNIGGWYDIFANGTLQNFSSLHRDSASPSKLLMGAWSHVNFGHVLGDLDLGIKASLSAIDMETDLTGLTQRWFDYWLKGIDTGIMDEPSVKLFVMGENIWRDESSFPLARTQYTNCYLHHGGKLDFETPTEEVPDQYIYDPADPTPTHGGAIHMHPVFGAGIRDQSQMLRHDWLVYTSEPLAQAIEVTGFVKANLWVASDAPDTDFVAHLIDVFPDGFAQNLASGIIRVRYRNGSLSSLLEPEKTYEVSIDLWATANLFGVGHRIQLQIASACFPRWASNPNTGSTMGGGLTPKKAHQTIFHDSSRPSHIVLPIIPR